MSLPCQCPSCSARRDGDRDRAETIQRIWQEAADDYDRACLAGNGYNTARAGGRLNGIEEVAAALGVVIDQPDPGGEAAREAPQKDSDLGGES